MSRRERENSKINYDFGNRGLANTGYAVVEEAGCKLIDCGILKIKNKANRLVAIYEELEKIIKKYSVEVVAVEEIFFAKNARSAIGVAQAIGVMKVCGLRCGLEVFGYTPLQVKMALVGYGRAEKEQVEVMVRNELGLSEPMSPSHAADAAAVALTHLFSKGRVYNEL